MNSQKPFRTQNLMTQSVANPGLFQTRGSNNNSVNNSRMNFVT